MSTIGFDKKLYIGSFGIILLTILIIGFVNFYQSKDSFLSKGKIRVQNVSDVLLKAVELKYNMQKEKINTEMGILISESLFTGDIFVDRNLVEMEIYDIRSNKKENASIPAIMFGLDPATNNHTTVEKASSLGVSEFSIYQFHDNKLVKVSSNIISKDGSRPIGEYYTKDSEQYNAVMGGELKFFLVKNGAEISMQILKPFVESLKGEIAGAYSITSKILTSDITELVNKVNVSGYGFSFVGDSDGNILVHPDKTYLSLKIQEFDNGEALLNGKLSSVIFKHDKRTYNAYVNYFEPWNLYFTTAVSEEDLLIGVNKQIVTSSFISGILALIIGALIISFMNRQLIKNMKGMANLVKEVSKGNFKQTFVYTANDAIKETVDGMNDMVEGLAEMIKDLNSGVHALSTTSGELNQISDQMSEGSETTVSKVNMVASAAEEMSVSMDSVAAAMEEASMNVETASNGTKDMNSNIEKVNHNSKKTQEITNKAVKQALQTSERVQKLGKAAEEINKVTDTISNISSQTNLLALNATIEAARAGEAGKGFAVVANEIKELAGQTAEATEEIGNNIQEIQEQISGAVTEIQEVSTIINQINDYVNKSAAAIGQQSSTTGEIAENVRQLSLGIQDVTINVNESSKVSGNVSAELSDVLTASQEINEFSNTVKEKSLILNDVMLKLKDITEKFEI